MPVDNASIVKVLCRRNTAQEAALQTPLRWNNRSVGMNSLVSINICICTCNRGRLLERCLQSVARVEAPAGVSLAITVIDNDAAQSARTLVDEFITTSPIPVFYVSEERRGIPFARNRAIDEAHRQKSDYLAFIDDDEHVPAEWMIRLYEMEVGQGGNVVVSGDVIAELPEETPVHIREMFQKKRSKTGTKLQTCATNNVLIPVYVTEKLGLRFDESRPLAGGTDTIFFCEAVARGAVIVRCAEASVFETIPDNRLNLRWLSKRKYRAGITEGWRKIHKGRPRFIVVFVQALRFSGEIIASALLAMAGQKTGRNRYWLKACRSIGMIAGVIGLNIDSYRQIDGA